MPTILIISREYFDYIPLFWLCNLFDILIDVITIVGIILFFKFKPCNFFALLLGLLMSPLLVFICCKHHSWLFKYWHTWVSIFVYALPFALISTIVFIIIRRKNKRKAVSFNQTDEQEKVN